MLSTVLLQLSVYSLVSSVSQHPVLLIVSYDAFRYNYFEKNATPFMNELRKKGTYADYLINVFPTKTFPNHHSIATGVYTETHGVVGNGFYDPKMRMVLGIEDDMWHYNDGVVPIWTLNEKMGEGRYSGSMMWPGSNYEYQGKKITYTQAWDPKMGWNDRVNTVIKWIKNPNKPANLVMLYIEEPDTHGHIYGPESDTIFNMLGRIDNLTQYLDDQLKLNQLQDIVNVIHLSDHGMSSVSPNNIVDITKYLIKDTYQIADSSPCLHLLPNSEHKEDIYNKLKNASKVDKHFRVFSKDELPAEWHFKNNRRTPPIFLLADQGYGFQDLTEAAKTYGKKYPMSGTDVAFGVHGYETTMKEMRPFFMARGPRVKSQHKVPPFHTVDLYNLFCDILGIKPVPNNGTHANVRDILLPVSLRTRFSTLGVAVAAVLVALLLIGCGSIITLVVIRRQQNITTAAALNKRFAQTSSSTTIEAQHLLEPEDA